MMAALRSYLGMMRHHPLVRRDRLAFVRRVLSWQMASRLLPRPVVVDYVNGQRLLLRRGHTGLTVHYYTGLYEYDDMLFVGHALRSSDLFVDVGANAGAYSVLAAGVTGARVLSLEPIPETFEALLDNISLNRMDHLVQARNIGAGSEEGMLDFSTARGAENRVLPPGADEPGVQVQVATLDGLLADYEPGGHDALLIKIDVEGWESEVLRGGHATLEQRRPCALLIEMNASGTRYGVTDPQLDEQIRGYGLSPVRYDADQRRLKQGRSPAGPNQLYVTDVAFFQERVSAAEPVRVGGHLI